MAERKGELASSSDGVGLSSMATRCASSSIPLHDPVSAVWKNTVYSARHDSPPGWGRLEPIDPWLGNGCELLEPVFQAATSDVGESPRYDATLAPRFLSRQEYPLPLLDEFRSPR